MKKLVLLAFSATASASTPSLKKLARTVAALQKTVKTQAARISSLQGKLTSDEATIASQGKELSDAASLLAIAPYVSLNASAMDGVTGGAFHDP